MTQEVEIKCINKTNRTDPHERISHVGGLNPDGSRWKMLEDDAITKVEDGTYRFWTQGGGRNVWVIIARSAAGHKYLKTESDGIHPNNLLALPECP
jgi:hypothetical protein